MVNNNQLNNLRKRARAAISQLESDFAGDKSKRAFLRGLESTVNENVRNMTKREREQYRTNLEQIARIGEAQTAAGRQNAIFRQRVNSGGVGDVETKIFYRATQGIWQGADPNARNEAIIEKFSNPRTRVGREFREYLNSQGQELREGDIQQIYEYVLNQNQDALDAAADGGELGAVQALQSPAYLFKVEVMR